MVTINTSRGQETLIRTILIGAGIACIIGLSIGIPLLWTAVAGGIAGFAWDFFYAKPRRTTDDEKKQREKNNERLRTYKFGQNKK